MKTEIKKVYQLDLNQKLRIGLDKYTFKGMDGMYARLFDKDDKLLLASCGTLVEIEK